MSYTIREASPPQIAVGRQPRPGGIMDVHQIQVHATRGPTTMDRQVSATENTFGSPAQDRGGWAPSADFVIGPDFRAGGALVIVQFGDWRDTFSTWSAGYGAAGQNTMPASRFGVAIELAQPAGLDRNGRYTEAVDATFEGFTPETTDAFLWLVRQIDDELARTTGDDRNRIPRVRIPSWDQHYPIPRGLIGHEDLANGWKGGKHDPGFLFPWDHVLAELNAPPPAPMPEPRPAPDLALVRSLLDGIEAAELVAWEKRRALREPVRALLDELEGAEITAWEKRNALRELLL